MRKKTIYLIAFWVTAALWYIPKFRRDMIDTYGGFWKTVKGSAQELMTQLEE